jgi:hypothetical protein
MAVAPTKRNQETQRTGKQRPTRPAKDQTSREKTFNYRLEKPSESSSLLLQTRVMVHAAIVDRIVRHNFSVI